MFIAQLLTGYSQMQHRGVAFGQLRRRFAHLRDQRGFQLFRLRKPIERGVLHARVNERG